MRTGARSPAIAAMLLAALTSAGCGAAAAKAGYGGAASGPYATKAESYGGYEAEYDEDYGYAQPAADYAYDEYAPAPEPGYAIASTGTAGGGGAWGGDIMGEATVADGAYLAELTKPADKGKDSPAFAPEPSDTETKTDATQQGPDRVILYVAEMNLAVFRVDEKIDEIRALIKVWNGYMISMDSNRIEFRVPAEKFEDALDELGKLGDVTYRNVNGTDVTDEYRDLQIRLKNAIAVRDRLLELLSQTKNINESLQVEHELERITEKIELMKGRLKYLSEAAAYSKITVHLSVKKKAKKPIPPLYAPFKWIQDVGLDTLFNF